MGHPRNPTCLQYNKPVKVRRKARLVSSFCTRVTTIVPSVTMRKNNSVPFPHCPGESQASPVSSKVAAMPNADGLKICLLPMRKRYLEATVKKAASRLVYQWFVLNRRQSPRALISALNPQDPNPAFVPGREVFSLAAK